MSTKIDIESYAKNVKAEHDRLRMFIARRTVVLMRERLADIYRECIRQFYSYKTLKYVRRGQSKPGTSSGKELYKALDTTKFSRGIPFTAPDTVEAGVEITSSLMDQQSYYYDSVDTVLAYIMNGTRFQKSLWIGRNIEMAHFTVEINTPWCSASGTPLSVLEECKDQMSETILDDVMEMAIKELKFEYINIKTN